MAAPAAGQPARSTTERRVIPTTAYGLTALLLLVIVALLPFALSSVVADLSQKSTPHFVISTPPTPNQDVHSSIHLTVIGVNEWENTATIRVAVHQSCDRACPWGDRYLIMSLYGDTPGGVQSQPSSEAVTLPAATHDVTSVIKLPLYGDPIRYPFDHYTLALGIVIDRLFPDGSSRTLSPAEAQEYATVTLQARAPRMVMLTPSALDPTSVTTTHPQDDFLTVQALTFARPLYLKVLTVFLVVLVTAAAAYAVFLRPLDQLIINAGALVLGVWGVRSILLGSSMSGMTVVDLALAVVILFLLVTISARTLWLLEEGSRLRLLRRTRAAPGATPAPAPAPAPGETGPPAYVPEREARVHRNGAVSMPEYRPERA